MIVDNIMNASKADGFSAGYKKYLFEKLGNFTKCRESVLTKKRMLVISKMKKEVELLKANVKAKEVQYIYM